MITLSKQKETYYEKIGKRDKKNKTRNSREFFYTKE